MNTNGGMTRIECAAVATIIVLLAGLSVPAYSEWREPPRVFDCFANMRMLGEAVFLYAGSEPGVFPAIAPVRKENDGAMVIFDPKTRSEAPTSTSLPSPTVDLWALLRGRFVVKGAQLAPKVFICPATKDKPDPVQDCAAYYDFASAKNLSYAYQYQHDPDRPDLGFDLSAGLVPLMADANPFIKGKVQEDILTDRLSKFRGNSTNHSKNKRGEQNILWSDGHAEMSLSPDLGLAGRVHKDLGKAYGRDNCYTVHRDLVDPGSEAPTARKCNLGSKSDSCLVP